MYLVLREGERLNIKFIAAVALVSIPVLLGDFNGRFVNPEADAAADQDNNSLPEGSIQFLSDQTRARISAALESFDVVKKVPVRKPTAKIKEQEKPQIMSVEEQKRQKGQLTDLYAGNSKYKLLATFDNNGQKFAHIIASDMVSGRVSNLRLDVGSKLSEYLVTAIDGNSVQLKQGTRLVSLQLFIYKQS